MSVQRFLIAIREDQFGNGSLHKDDCGDGVRFEDYAALEARCAWMREALFECQRLFRNLHDYGALRHEEDWNKVENVWDIVSVALADTTTDEVQS